MIDRYIDRYVIAMENTPKPRIFLLREKKNITTHISI